MADDEGPVSPKWNIDKFSYDDLLDTLNLPQNPTSKKVIATADSIISRMVHNGLIEEAQFFENAKQKILANVDDDAEYEEQDEKDNDSTTLGNWWNYQYPKQGDLNQADKTTSRHQKVQLFDNDHQQMNRERLGVNQMYNVPVMQGTINPNQRNTTQRMVYIDSAHRANILPYAGTNPNHPSFNTDFTLDLSEPLINVLSIQLHSIQIPKTWYTFDLHLGNICFALYHHGDPPHCTCIPPGNYDVSGVLDAINSAAVDVLPVPPADPFLNIGVGGRVSYKNPDYIFRYYQTDGLQLDSTGSCTPSCRGSGYIDQNLGWNLGFRQDLSENSYLAVEGDHIAEALPDVYGPKSLFLVVDDFNQNHLNKGLVSTSDRPTKLPLPTYYEPGQVTNYGGDLSCVSIPPPLGQGVGTDTKGARVVKTYPRRLTQAQIYSANEIIANRIRPDLRTPPLTTNDVLAVIPLANASRSPSSEYDASHNRTIPFIVSGQDLRINERSYFGPVNIERLRIKLIDDKGNLVNLNGVDWSFTLIVEQLYQY